MVFFSFFCPQTVAAISVYATVLDGPIDPATLFTTVITFNQLRFALIQYPVALATYAEFTVSRRRLAAFFSLEERATTQSKTSNGNSVAIRVDNGTFYWSNPELVETQREEKKKEEEKKAKKNKHNKVEVASRSEQNVLQDVKVEGPIVPVLRDISLEILENELIAVVGSVASGKHGLCVFVSFVAHRDVTPSCRT